MKAQILISSYPKDYEWLIHCLAAIGKFSRGFLPTVVCVDTNDVSSAQSIIRQSNHNCKTAIFPQKQGMSGFMRAQLGMMHSDIMCPDADVIFFLGSDCCPYAPFDPQMYCDPQGRPAVIISNYDRLAVPWRGGTCRTLGFNPNYEYMRRLPTVYPRGIFSPMRAHVEKLHKKAFLEYIYTSDARHHDISEANILGAFAHKFMPDTCHWVDVAATGLHGSEIDGWPSPIIQMWSRGGLDRPMEACAIYTSIKGVVKNSVGRTPRYVINDILYGLNSD